MFGYAKRFLRNIDAYISTYIYIYTCVYIYIYIYVYTYNADAMDSIARKLI